MDEYVPKSLHVGRSETGRKLTCSRYYENNKKSKLTAYLWFIFLRGLSAHWIYLKLWGLAGITFLLRAVPFLIVIISETNVSSEALDQIFIFAALLWCVLILFELVLVAYFTRKVNRIFYADLLKEFGLT